MSIVSLGHTSGTRRQQFGMADAAFRHSIHIRLHKHLKLHYLIYRIKKKKKNPKSKRKQKQWNRISWRDQCGYMEIESDIIYMYMYIYIIWI